MAGRDVQVIRAVATHGERADRIARRHDRNRADGGLHVADAGQRDDHCAEADGLHHLADGGAVEAAADQGVGGPAGDAQEHERGDVRHHRVEADAGEVHVQRLVDIGGHPAEQHVQRPVVAEMADDDRPQRLVAQQQLQWRQFDDHLLGVGATADQRQFLRADGGMLLWPRSDLRHPETKPHEAEGPEDVKHPLPAELHRDERRQRECEQGAGRNAAGVHAHRAGAFRRRKPAADQAVDGRERETLAQPHADPREQQRDESRARREGRHHREQRPRHHAQTQHEFAAEPVGQPAPQELRQDVADEERRQHAALLLGIPVVLLRHGNDGDGDVDAIDVADEHGQKTQADQGVAALPAGGRHRRFSHLPLPCSILLAGCQPFRTAPDAMRSATSAADNPAPNSTSLVCWPSFGAGPLGPTSAV